MDIKSVLRILAVPAAICFVLPACESPYETTREQRAEELEERADEIADEAEGAVEEGAREVEETADEIE